MEVTQVRVFPVDEEKLKAFVSVIFDDCFVVSDIKIIEGTSGLFVSMPSKKRRDGTFRDIAHPLNNETRRKIEERVIGEYRQAVSRDGGSADAPMRRLEDAASRPEATGAERSSEPSPDDVGPAEHGETQDPPAPLGSDGSGA